MSLLLKALKQAEKGGAGPPEPTDLDLEPLTLATPKPRPQWVDPGEPAVPEAPRARLSLPRLGLVPATALIALLVAGAYGIYVYRALHPAGFAALGIGLATGKPALLVTTSGTAAAEVHAAVVEAHGGAVP